MPRFPLLLALFFSFPPAIAELALRGAVLVPSAIGPFNLYPRGPSEDNLVCASSQSLCPDGFGCCSVGVACTTSGDRPVCNEPCHGDPCSSGIGCCPYGYLCPTPSSDICVSFGIDSFLSFHLTTTSVASELSTIILATEQTYTTLWMSTTDLRPSPGLARAKASSAATTQPAATATGPTITTSAQAPDSTTLDTLASAPTVTAENGGGEDGLSQNTKLGLGLGIGVGVPVVAAALAALLAFLWKRGKREKNALGIDSHMQSAVGIQRDNPAGSQ